MNTEALRQMIRVLEAVPDKKFDIASWRSDGMFGPVRRALGACGTTACAVGWAAHDPWFQAHGLRLKRVQTIHNVETWQPVYGAWAGPRAVMEFFSIDDDAMRSVFYRAGYDDDTLLPVKDQVIYRIQQMLEEAEKANDPPAPAKDGQRVEATL
jgi:hypothetical protein